MIVCSGWFKKGVVKIQNRVKKGGGRRVNVLGEGPRTPFLGFYVGVVILPLLSKLYIRANIIE